MVSDILPVCFDDVARLTAFFPMRNIVFEHGEAVVLSLSWQSRDPGSIPGNPLCKSLALCIFSTHLLTLSSGLQPTNQSKCFESAIQHPCAYYCANYDARYKRGSHWSLPICQEDGCPCHSEALQVQTSLFLTVKAAAHNTVHNHFE